MLHDCTVRVVSLELWVAVYMKSVCVRVSWWVIVNRIMCVHSCVCEVSVQAARLVCGSVRAAVCVFPCQSLVLKLISLL